MPGVNVYDSVYVTLSAGAKEAISNLFDLSTSPDYNMLPMQKQSGLKDCGLFSIATTTALLFGKDMSKVTFYQSEIRKHLYACFEAKLLSPFP